MNKETKILSTAYLAPIQYFSIIANSKSLLIETKENYVKQSFRNRCEIYAANGKLTLSITVKKNNNSKTSIKDVKIDYSTPWQRLHWISIESAYRSSPFFEFYADEFKMFFRKKTKYLFDFNDELFKTVLSILEIETEINYSSNFVQLESDNQNDYRFIIHPKKDFSFVHETAAYTQVFNIKHGFIPNLSIIDLIFNEGPNAINLLTGK